MINRFSHEVTHIINIEHTINSTSQFVYFLIAQKLCLVTTCTKLSTTSSVTFSQTKLYSLAITGNNLHHSRDIGTILPFIMFIYKVSLFTHEAITTHLHQNKNVLEVPDDISERNILGSTPEMRVTL